MLCAPRFRAGRHTSLRTESPGLRVRARQATHSISRSIARTRPAGASCIGTWIERLCRRLSDLTKQFSRSSGESHELTRRTVVEVARASPFGWVGIVELCGDVVVASPTDTSAHFGHPPITAHRPTSGEVQRGASTTVSERSKPRVVLIQVGHSIATSKLVGIDPARGKRSSRRAESRLCDLVHDARRGCEQPPPASTAATPGDAPRPRAQPPPHQLVGPRSRPQFPIVRPRSRARPRSESVKQR